MKLLKSTINGPDTPTAIAFFYLLLKEPGRERKYPRHPAPLKSSRK